MINSMGCVTSTALEVVASASGEKFGLLWEVLALPTQGWSIRTMSDRLLNHNTMEQHKHADDTLQISSMRMIAASARPSHAC